MVDITTDRLRNIALISHSGAGKTILSETMLHASGAISRMGTIEDGTTSSDYEPEEARRQTSIQTAIVPCHWKGHKINVLDTPGYADFRGEVTSAIRAADGAVVVVSASSGIEVGTQQMWKMSGERGLARIVYISKMDRENADFQKITDSLTERFGRECVAINIPIGAETNFSGTINLLASDVDVPDSIKDEVETARERLIEAVAESDDELATKYLEGEPLSQEDLTRGLKNGVTSGAIVPVLAGSSNKDVSVKELMNAIVNYMPSPGEMPPVTGTNASSNKEISLNCDVNDPLSALIFKTSADPFVGKLSYFRVYSGILKSNSQTWNANQNEGERIGQVFEVLGKSQEAVPHLVAGDIGAVSKLSSVLTGNTLSNKEQPVILPGVEFPPAVYQMAAYPKSKADVDKMTSSITRISEEDPSLTITRDSDTLEILLGGLGDTHVEVAVEKMKRKFGVDIVLELPKISYKETIGIGTKVEHKHKKQSGGHGQYGHVWLELQPLPRGSGFEFDQKVVGGVVPKEYIPSVQKGVLKALTDGSIAGYPVVDLKATLVDGSYHPVDSSGIAFEIAGTHAFTKGMSEANPVLLEPITQIHITVPDDFTGDVAGDLNSKRAHIQGMTPQGDGTTLIEAEAPQAEMLRYATELRSQTQGQGYFTMEFDHYEEVPQHQVSQVVQNVKQQEEARA